MMIKRLFDVRGVEARGDPVRPLTGDVTGGRNPCPGSPAACGEHISAQQEALKLAERATHQGTVPLASLTRGQAYENRRQEGSLGICCCDCCCLINRLRAGAGADAWRCRGGMERQRASRHRGTGRRGTVRPPTSSSGNRCNSLRTGCRRILSQRSIRASEGSSSCGRGGTSRRRGTGRGDVGKSPLRMSLRTTR